MNCVYLHEASMKRLADFGGFVKFFFGKFLKKNIGVGIEEKKERIYGKGEWEKKGGRKRAGAGYKRREGDSRKLRVEARVHQAKAVLPQ